MLVEGWVFATGVANHAIGFAQYVRRPGVGGVKLLPGERLLREVC